MIAHEGPITVERYMDLCLRHYYANRDPLGREGDFTTAPEISQIFGELIGLWLVEVWHEMGRPDPFNLVELGPGRGTLMADILRASKVMPDFSAAARLHLVETSPALRDRQRATLAASGQAITWCDSFDGVLGGPLLVVANEFFDALPIRQFVATEGGWRERRVGLSGDALVFGLGSEPEPDLGPSPGTRALREVHGASLSVIAAIARRLQRDRGVLLMIDYGYWGPAFGDTLQAVKNHAPVDPLAEPGEADLTAHVDFAQLAHAAKAHGVRVHGIETQACFLHSLGISSRAMRLKQAATPSQAQAIESAIDRLTAGGERGMGQLFKVLALTDSRMESVPGLRPGLDAPRR